MAKTATLSTDSPERFIVGHPIYFEDVIGIAEMQNYAFSEDPTIHVSAETGLSGWGQSGDEKATHAAVFKSSTRTFYRFWLKKDVDVQEFRIGARCAMTAANTGTVLFFFNRGLADEHVQALSFTASDTEEKQATLDVAALTAGWVTVEIDLRRDSGSSAVNELRSIRIEDGYSVNLGSPALETCAVIVGAGNYVKVLGTQVLVEC